MFTGIIEEIGNVVSMSKHDNLTFWNGEIGSGYILQVTCPLAVSDAYNGCSIAINGTCLTVIDFDSNLQVASFGCSPETLRRTNLGNLKQGDTVNVERSVKVNDRNSGHFVQGHVDGTGRIMELNREGDSLWVKIEADDDILKYIVSKGYIAIDGTSLTVCQVDKNKKWFNIMLVAYTQSKITLPSKEKNSLVNLEVDIIGKHVGRAIEPYLQQIRSSSFMCIPFNALYLTAYFLGGVCTSLVAHRLSHHHN